MPTYVMNFTVTITVDAAERPSHVPVCIAIEDLVHDTAEVGMLFAQGTHAAVTETTVVFSGAQPR